MKRNVMVGLIVGLLLLSLACGGGSSTPKPTELATQPVARGLEIKISNQSPYDICYVQISASDQDQWGEDQLGAQEKIAPSASRSFTVAAGAHDVKVMDCSQRTLATFWSLDRGTTVEVGGRGLAPLVILNTSGTEICYVYVAPSTDDTWGEDWLGPAEGLAAREGARVFFVRPGTYDMLVQDCDGNDLVSEFEVSVTEEITWTISD